MAKSSLYKISYSESKEYLEFVDQIFSEIEFSKQIYIDFRDALVMQKAKQNFFISWCMSNYYNCVILSLCKLLEPRKNDRNKYTLKHFVNLIKYKPNYEMLKSEYDSKVIELHNIHTGETEKISVAKEYLELLKSIDFDNDLEHIEKMHNKICDYRNKRLCHNEKINSDFAKLPGIDELHKYIEEIEEMMTKYFGLFGVGMSYKNLKTPNIYFNFHLFLK